MLIALVGAVAGQAVVWYTGQFYALFFLEKTLKVDGATANILVAIALALATPFFILFGWLSDKKGRKQIIMAGCLAAAATYFPLFGALTTAANPALAKAQASAPVVVHSDPALCSVQFDPIGKAKFDRTACDVAKSTLAKAGISYANALDGAGEVTTGTRTVARTGGGRWKIRVSKNCTRIIATTGSTSTPGWPWSMEGLWRFLKWRLGSKAEYSEEEKNHRPQFIPELKKRIQALPEGGFIAWIGHSTFLLRIQCDYRITDPIFSKRALLPKRITPPAITGQELRDLTLV